MRPTIIALMLLALSGCGPATSPTPPADLAGIWAVTGHRLPGVSAIDDSAALALYGRIIRLSDTAGWSGSARCDRPRYRRLSGPRDSILAADYRLGAGALPMLEEHPTLEIVQVTCGGEPWTEPGGTLIAVDTDHALTPWDGAFLELTRTHDITASGHGPDWEVRLVRGDSIRFRRDSAAATVTTPDAREVEVAGSDTRMVRAITEAHDLGVMLEPAACVDAVSGKTLPLTVTVLLDGQRYHGCGRPVE